MELKKRKKRKGGRKCTPPAKRRVKVQMKNLIFLISRILRICVRRFKGHQNGVEIFPFFFKFWHCILKFPNKQSPRYVSCFVTQNVESNVNDMSNVIKLCKLYIASALFNFTDTGLLYKQCLGFLAGETANQSELRFLVITFKTQIQASLAHSIMDPSI